MRGGSTPPSNSSRSASHLRPRGNSLELSVFPPGRQVPFTRSAHAIVPLPSRQARVEAHGRLRSSNIHPFAPIPTVPRLSLSTVTGAPAPATGTVPTGGTAKATATCVKDWYADTTPAHTRLHAVSIDQIWADEIHARLDLVSRVATPAPRYVLSTSAFALFRSNIPFFLLLRHRTHDHYTKQTHTHKRNPLLLQFSALRAPPQRSRTPVPIPVSLSCDTPNTTPFAFSTTHSLHITAPCISVCICACSPRRRC